MTKKKHQKEPGQDSDGSTASSDKNENVAKCPHIIKAVDFTRVKKRTALIGFLESCPECKNCPIINVPDGFELDETLWLCLKCGNQACGRSKNQHALMHYNIPHSDCHALCVNITTWLVWCYICDNEINIATSKKLHDAVEYFRKNCEATQNQLVNKSDLVKDIDMEIRPSIFLNNVSEVMVINLPKTCGLTNLGNTCFFNSVMQCLGQTPYLLELLEETSSPGQYFSLPGGKLVISEKAEIDLDPLDGNLVEWSVLTQSLAETLRVLQSGQTQVHTPKSLLSRLTHRLPQFGGGDQHDSHELLRHLLEAVREEDLRRYQSVILHKLGFSRKTDPSSVEGEQKKIVRFYGQQASELLLPTEQIFRGVLISTLQCKECRHTSHREEYFLDLSLPITERQIPPALRRKADDSEEKSKSKLKKEKRAAKKNKKHKGNNKYSLYKQTNKMNDSNEVNKSDSESDADVEDNIEDYKLSVTINQNDVTETVEQMKTEESGYNSDKNANDMNTANDEIPSIDTDMVIDSSNSPVSMLGLMNVSPVSQNSPLLNEISVESSVSEQHSPYELTEAMERPESRLSFTNMKNSDLKEDLEKLSLMNDGDKGIGKLSRNSDNSMDDLCNNTNDMDEKMEEDSDSDLWMDTMSPRYQCEEGECSVQSCLSQFTSCELMTASNKVSCELCTKRAPGKEKKTVYANAWKQLLIYNPPAVLILHLKRFQVYHFRPTKISKHVSFPTLLDLSPFCLKRSQNVPMSEASQSKVLYSLYGVVEHSGSMHGGHYIAYVKVRSKLEKDNYRWQFLPKNQSGERGASSYSSGAQAVPDAPLGKWYYVSDSYVTEVKESKVLNAHAYLLFYERIL